MKRKILMKAIHVNKLDNVATALASLHKGDTVLGTLLLQDIPQGHTFAIPAIAQGNPVIPYTSHIRNANMRHILVLPVVL